MSKGAPWGIPTIDQRKLYVVASGVRAYDLETGTLVWQAPIHAQGPWKLLVAGRTVLVVEATVYALDADNGKLLWEYHPSDNASLGRATVERGTLFFGGGHKLYAIRISDGKNLWTTDIAPGAKYSTTIRGVTVHEDTLYSSVEHWRSSTGNLSSGWLVALDRKSGRVRWRFVTGKSNERRGLSSSPVVAGRLVLASDYFSNAVVAVDRYTRRLQWRFTGEKGFVGFPEAPLIAGDEVYVASGDTYAYALDLPTGRQLWRRRLSGSNEAYALCGRSLLVNHQGITVIDRKTGEIQQSILDTESEYASSDFAVTPNHVYVSGPKGVYGLSCQY